jgi:hypothetical protein
VIKQQRVKKRREIEQRIMKRIKIIGRKKGERKGLKTAAPFLELIVQLRGNKPFIPKGIHRFKSFEESSRWSIQMMARH